MRYPSILRSSSCNPYDNLALEEYLRQKGGSFQPLLYLWQNEKTVVFGRNQNPWRECHLDLLQKDGGFPARRASGGGAVFHDLGNLNFTFLLPTPLFDVNRQISVIARALQSFGISTSYSGRNDLLAEGAKFSGNAYYKAREASYHHGTLLVKADMALLGKYLRVSPAKLRSKGVASIQSRVINLASLQQNLTIESLEEALGQAFLEEYGLPREAPFTFDFQDLQKDPLFSECRHRFSVQECIFGNSPTFDLALENRFSWGGLELLIPSAKGKITSLEINSDALETEEIARIPEFLEECPLSFPVMAEHLESRAQTFSSGENQRIFKDIALWLASNPLHGESSIEPQQK